MPPQLSVAIVGGGLCGVVCAYALHKAGITVDLFEANSRFEEIGAGVGVGPNAVRVLRSLGVLEHIISRPGVQIPTTERTFLFRSGYDSHELVYDYHTARANETGFAVYRPVFIAAIVDNMDAAIFHFNKRCVSVSADEAGNPSLSFSDGTVFQASLVIGTDGVRSITRTFLEEGERLRYSNTVAYRGLIPRGALDSVGLQLELFRRPVCLMGKGKHIITFPVMGDTVLNVVVFSSNPGIPTSPPMPLPWVRESFEKEILDEFQDWGQDAITLLEHMRHANKWMIHEVGPPLEKYHKGRVVLVGDAAHAMRPHLGAGAGQGFEDVYALVRLLESVVSTNIALDDAINVYSDIRPPRANMVLEGSAHAGDIYDSYTPGRDEFTADQLVDLWGPVWHHDLEKEMDEIISMLSKQ